MTVARISVLSPSALDRELATEREYWLGRLAGAPEPCGIPLDLRRPAEPGARHTTLGFRLGAETAERVRTLSAGNPSLTFALLLAAVKVCLARYNGRQEVVVGTAIHEEHGEVAALNRVLALRDRIDPDLEVRDLLRGVKATVAEAVEHQKFPFDRVLDLLEISVPKNRAPLFDVVVTLDGIHDRENVAAVKADVAVAFRLVDGDVAADVTYRGDLYRRRTVELFAEHVTHVVDRMVRSPGARVRDLDLVDAERRSRLADAAAGAATPYPRQRTTAELFAEAAGADPGATALLCDGRERTYGELHRRSEALARVLASRGVGRGTAVAVCLDRSPELVEAVLALMRLGAVFVPLDPEHPAGRRRLVVEDSGAAALLVAAPDSELEVDGVDAVALEELEREAAAAAETGVELPAPPRPDDLAYVIYTSGSTGRPKGVAVQHRALLSYLWWAREVYLRGEPAAFGLYTSPAFDLTVTSLLLPLVTGNRLVIYPDPMVDLHRVMDDGLVEVVKVTPSHLALIRDRDCRDSAVRRIIVGGEAFETPLARRVHERFGGGVEIYNEYGPTEATVGCMIHRFDPSEDRRAYVPIGEPAANARVYLLDADLQPVAENVVGELYLGGDGLAVGYLGRPRRTAESFLPDPFGDGTRLYRTGDRARRLPEGGLEFLGRTDDQVKFHGYRIELNEIRAALNDHPGVRDSVVVLAGEGDGQVLVAYYAARHELDTEELRDFLADRLIEATIPNLFVHLRRLPLTLHGKVNRDALPSLEEARDRVKRVYAPPRTDVEKLLAEIWRDVLQVPRVGLHDSFFEMGGHSLLATRVVSRLREELGVEVALARLFDTRTLTAFSAVVEELRRGGEGAGTPPIRPVPREGDGLPLSFAQQRLWFLDRLEPGSPGYNILSAVRLDGDLDVALLSRALTTLVARHESLRTVFRGEETPRQLVQPAAPPPLPRVDLRALPEAARQRALDGCMRAASNRSFDLSAGPLLHLVLVRLDDRSRAVLLTMHHIVSDGWSLSLLIDELVRLYAAYSRGESSPLPELPIQYGDYAVWQREWLSGDELERQLDYWRSRIVGMPPLELPTDRPRPPVQSFRGGTVSTDLPGELGERLKSLAEAEGTTLFAVLLAAFEAVLGRWSGQDRFGVGTFIAGRNRSELEGLVGFFVNNLVLCAELEGRPTFRELLGRVRGDTLAAYAHQDIPFEKLLEELDVPRDLSRTPVFQTMFVFQNLPEPSLEMPGVELSMLPVSTRRSNFDLTLWMYETAGGLRASFHYSRDLFDEDTVSRLLDHLGSVLERAADDPDRRLVELTAARGEDVRRLSAWSRGEEARREPVEPVHLQVAARAAETPEATAVVGGGREMSYGELDRRAGILAERLARAGVGPETPVAVLLDRTPELIVALLGVLRSGAHYVPLDPAVPDGRLEAILDALGVTRVVAAAGAGEGSPRPDIEVVPVPPDDRTATPPPPTPPAGGEALAYAIHTSGSTGLPKAVGVSHDALAGYVDTLARATDLGADDRVLQFASPSFDTAAEEIFGALTRGAALVLRDDDMLSSVPTFLGACDAHGVTVLDLPTVFWNQALGEEELSLPGAVRLVIIGGERALPDRWQAWRRRVGERVRLLNTYGPTEATIVKTWADLTRAPGGGEAPIGRPVPGASAWVVGRDGELVPAGVPGELWLGGGLARGYLGRPAATAAAFVPDPFGGGEGERLYRTGDLARWRPDGQLEFLGRVDHQVKVRGFRVELGEVEGALSALPEVSEAVAGLVTTSAGPPLLVAWVTAAGDTEPRPSALRGALRERLPDYMVPAAVAVLAELPRLASGKVDRRSLPEPEPGRDERAGFQEPRNEEEEAIVEIWKPLLGVDRIGVYDNFFDLGGHSLLATQIVARIRKAMGVEVPLRRFFEAPTVAELTLVVEEILIEELEELSEEEALLLLEDEEGSEE